MINCKNCNKPFQPTFNKGSEQVYCSVKCRQENAQKRMYNKIREEVIGNIEKPIEKHNAPVQYAPISNSNEILELRMEIEKMKYEQKLKEIENSYSILFSKMQSNMDLIRRKLEEDEEEPIEDNSNDFLQALSGIAPLIIEKLQKQA
jgi:hypothetical protein